jgi:hypothetical protein
MRLNHVRSTDFLELLASLRVIGVLCIQSAYKQLKKKTILTLSWIKYDTVRVPMTYHPPTTHRMVRHCLFRVQRLQPM